MIDAADIPKEFEDKGYVVLPDVLTNNECDYFKGLLESDYQKYSPLYAGSKSKTTHGLESLSVVKTVYNMPLEIYNQLSDERKDLLGYRSQPPKDEFTRLRRKSEDFEDPADYRLPV